MLRYIGWAIYNKGRKVSKAQKYERIFRFVTNYYKKQKNTKSKFNISKEVIMTKLYEEEIKRKKILILKKKYNSCMTEYRKVEGYNNNSLSSNIIKSRNQDILNNNLKLELSNNKILNYFNSKRNKNLIIKKKIKLYLKDKEKIKNITENITEGHRIDIESRKISNKLLAPNYYFTAKYIEKSMPPQAKHWISNVYYFLKKEGATLTLLDRFTNELIKRFFAVKRIKRKLVWDDLLTEVIKFKTQSNVYKRFNKILKYSTNRRRVLGSDITTYFHPGILNSKWLKRQINKSIKIRKSLLRRKIKMFGGFMPKKKSTIIKWRKILIGKPIFKHTPFNLIIDLFIYNSKTHTIKKFKNMMLRRISYKYMYSMYVDVNKKINETLNRPRFFYMNIIEPKIFPYYTKIVRSYEDWLFVYNKNLVLTICLMLIKINELSKKNINILKNKLISSFTDTVVNKSKNFLLNNMYIKILNQLGINQLYNINKENIEIKTKKVKTTDESLDKKPYKVKNYPEVKYLDPLLWWKNYTERFFKKRKKVKSRYRVKKFGEKKLSYQQYKKDNFMDRRKGKQIDPKVWDEKLKGFHLYSRQQKKDLPTNKKKYIWYSKEEWAISKKNKKDKYKDAKFEHRKKFWNKNIKDNKTWKKNIGYNKDLIKKTNNDINKETKRIENINWDYNAEIINGYGPLNIWLSNPDNFKNTELENLSSLKEFDKNEFLEDKVVKSDINSESKKYIEDSIILIGNNKYNKSIYSKYFIPYNKDSDLDDFNTDKDKIEKKYIILDVKYKSNNKLSKTQVLKGERDNFKSSLIILSKKKWLKKKEIIKNRYILESNKTVSLPLKIKKIKRKRKKKNNAINLSLNLKKDVNIKNIHRNKYIENSNIVKLPRDKQNIKIKSVSSKRIWDKLDYSLLSILSKYLKGKDRFKFQSNSMLINSIYNKSKNMLIVSNIWYAMYSLNFIKNEYSNIVKNIITSKVWDEIPESVDRIKNIYVIKNSYFSGNFIYGRKLMNIVGKNQRITLKGFSRNSNNKREGELKNKFFYYENIFKSYYRYMIPIYIMEYYKYYLLYVWRNYWLYSLQLFIINKIKGINKSHMMLLNFIVVKTLLGLLRYNYRSILKMKPKYYYLNKLRNYETKFRKINLNSWANSVRYIRRLRKTPKNFWSRYHRIASFYLGRVIKNAELDTKRKIFVPFVLYFEDILYNIYGKWTIIRLWPLKRYYLSSYILAKRIMVIILWRARKIRTITRFRTRTRYLMTVVRFGQITRSYHDYYKNTIAKWPSSLLDHINEKSKSRFLTYKNLEYKIERKERYFTFNTHILLRNKLSYNHFNIWYKDIVGNKLTNYRHFFKTRRDLNNDIDRPPAEDVSVYLKVWLAPFRLYLRRLTLKNDISSVRFTLAGRTGTKRNNTRKTYKTKFYGQARGPRYWAPIQRKFFNIGIPTIRGDMKSNYDYSKTISKSISGAMSVKVWLTSKISTDIQELLMYLLDIKHLYLQFFNRYYLVAKRFKFSEESKKKWRRLKRPKRRSNINRRSSIRFIIKQREILKKRRLLRYDIYRKLAYLKNIEKIS